MAYSNTQWREARTLFERGVALREIEKQTGISFGGIAKRAKKEEWRANLYEQLASDRVANIIEKKEIEERIDALPPQGRAIVEASTLDKLALANYFHNAGLEVLDIALDALRSEPSTYNAKNTMETLKTGRIVTGLDAMHASAATITNTIAQQNVIDGEVVDMDAFNWEILPVESPHALNSD
jgi:hypothetical protein